MEKLFGKPTAITLAAVRKFKPCDDAMNRLSVILPKRDKIDAAKARELGATYDDVIWIASAVAMDNDAIARRLTGYVNDCAKRVLYIWEQDNPDDDRPRKCIMACDAFIAGIGTEEAWKEAAWAAWAARDARAARAAWDAWAARAARDARAARAAWDAWAAWAARAARAARAAWDALYAWQFDLLIYWLTEAAPVPLPMPEHGKDVEGFEKEEAK